MSNPRAFVELPLIDFEPFLKGSLEEKKEVAMKIGHACRNVGFYYLKNHGVSQELLDHVLKESKAFFAMSLEEKMKIRKTDEHFETGYNPIYNEKISRLGDFKETFDFLRELPADDPYLQMTGSNFYSGNMWPENCPKFREVIYEQYTNEMVKLAEKVMESYALAFDLPIDYFKPMTQKPICLGRLTHYFAPKEELTQEQLSCGVHTDQLAVTLVAQLDGHPGLQVKNDCGEWITATPIPGTLVVNIGDLIERWSNGHFKATEHRVFMEPGVERYSAIFFHMPDYHAKIECCIKGEKPKYPPITAGEFLLKREINYYGSSENWLEHEESLRATDKFFSAVQKT